MKNFLVNIAKTLGPRVIGVACAGLAGWLQVHTKGSLVLDADATAKLVTTMVGSYAVGHRLSSIVVNPGDAATPRVTDAIKDAADSSGVVKVDRKF